MCDGGEDFAERTALDLGRALAEEFLQGTTVSPVVAQLAKSVELHLAHEAPIVKAMSRGVKAKTIVKLGRELDAGRQILHANELFHGDPPSLESMTGQHERNIGSRDLYHSVLPISRVGVD
jgi:hypothetical protein